MLPLTQQHVKEIADAVTGDTMPIPTSRLQVCRDSPLLSSLTYSVSMSLPQHRRRAHALTDVPAAITCRPSRGRKLTSNVHRSNESTVSHSITRSLTHSHTHTHTHCRLSVCLSVCLSVSLSLTHTHTHTNTHTLSLSHTHTHMLSLSVLCCLHDRFDYHRRLVVVYVTVG